MSDRQRHDAPDASGDEPLLRALRELGTDYEPNVAAITRRAEGLRPGQPHRAGPRAQSRLPAAVRHSRPVLLPAAAVLLVMGGVVLATAPRPDSGSKPTAHGQVTEAPAVPAPSSDPTSEPSRVGTAVSATRPPIGATTTEPRTTETRQPARKQTAEVAVKALATGAITDIDLSRPVLQDWLVLGARADLKQVRAKAGAADPQITLDQPAQATSVTGPFRISWTDGVPEQDHTGADAWLAAPARPGLSVSIAASTRPRTVVLYAGAVGSDATLSVSGTGITTRRTQLGPATQQGRVLLVTISLPVTSGPTRILLQGSADDEPKAQVYLAGVTLP